MTIATTFDPGAKVSDSFNTNLPTNGKFLLINQSNVNLLLTFANGKNLYAPAWQIWPFNIPTKSPVVKWTQQSILAGTSPISQVTIDAYQPGEAIPGTYPVAIQHVAYIPNTVNTAMGSSTSVQNDNNLQSVFVEATLSGSPSSNVSIDNAGNAYFAQTVGGVTSKIFQILANSSSILIIGSNLFIIDNNGNITKCGNITSQGQLSLDSTKITSDGNGNLVTKTVSNAQGIICGVFPTQYRFANNDAINTAKNYQITGNGSPVIPSGAKYALVSCYYVGSVAGTFVNMYPTGATLSDASNYPLMGQAQVTSGQCVATGIIPLSLGGSLTALPSQSISAFNATVYAFMI